MKLPRLITRRRAKWAGLTVLAILCAALAWRGYRAWTLPNREIRSMFEQVSESYREGNRDKLAVMMGPRSLALAEDTLTAARSDNRATLQARSLWTMSQVLHARQQFSRQELQQLTAQEFLRANLANYEPEPEPPTLMKVRIRPDTAWAEIDVHIDHRRVQGDFFTKVGETWMFEPIVFELAMIEVYLPQFITPGGSGVSVAQIEEATEEDTGIEFDPRLWDGPIDR